MPRKAAGPVAEYGRLGSRLAGRVRIRMLTTRCPAEEVKVSVVLGQVTTNSQVGKDEASHGSLAVLMVGQSNIPVHANE
jgi:hypothetical protein